MHHIISSDSEGLDRSGQHSIMERVRVVSTETILPATYRPESTPQRIDFTPWDLQFLLLGSIQKGILYSHSMPDHVHLLKTSLSRTLDYFYPLAGRLCYDEDVEKNAKLYYIECNNGGVEFVQAVSEDINVADILKAEYDVGIIRRLFPQNGLLNIECDVKPFFSVQITELAGGGCFIGCTLSHMFADGTSFWHLMNSWSEISRGCGIISEQPVLDRQYPHKSKVWIPNKSIVSLKKPTSESPRSLKEMILHLSKEKIASLKLKAIEEAANQKISSLQALLAHIWRTVSRSQGLDANNDVHLVIAIGTRGRTEPALPTHYFGNAVYFAKGSLKCEDILTEDGLGRAACQLNKLVSMQTASVVEDFIRSWNENPTLLCLDTNVGSNTLATSSSPKFDVYGTDFGWGRPVAVRSGGAHKVKGKITLFAGAENDGSVDVEVCLPSETMKAFKRDGEFADGAY